VKLRRLFQILALAGALVFTAYQGAITERDYKNLQSSVQIGDRSAADLYGLNFKIDVVEILVAWIFSCAVVYVLRAKKLKP